MYDSDLFLFKRLFYAIYIKVNLKMSPFQIGIVPSGSQHDARTIPKNGTWFPVILFFNIDHRPFDHSKALKSII